MIIGGDNHRDGACGVRICTGQSRIRLGFHQLLSSAGHDVNSVRSSAASEAKS
jgi:hypothetical protein